MVVEAACGTGSGKFTLTGKIKAESGADCCGLHDITAKAEAGAPKHIMVRAVREK